MERQTPKLLPINKAAEVIGVHYRQLLDAVNEGEIPHYRIKKSHRLVSVPEVLAIMKSKEEKNGQ